MDIALQAHHETGFESLLPRAASGEAAALEHIHERLFKRVRQLCRYLLGSPGDAEDAAGELFLRLERLAGSYDGRIPFDAYLMKAASHYCIDQLRRQRVEARLFVDEPPEEIPVASGDPSPLTALLLKEQRRELERAIGQLPSACRLPLVLRYYRDLSYDEIAAELGTSRSQVAAALFRARHALRRALEKTKKGALP